MKLDFGTHELDILKSLPAFLFGLGGIVALVVGQPALAMGLFTSAGANFLSSPVTKKE
jgi:hypothetical protein